MSRTRSGKISRVMRKNSEENGKISILSGPYMRRETIRNSAVSLYQRAIERSLAGKRGKSSNGLLRNSTYRSLLKVRDGLPICPQGELTCCRGPIFRPKLAKFLSYKKIIFLGTSGNASLRNFVFKPGSDGFGYRILIRANKTR